MIFLVTFSPNFGIIFVFFSFLFYRDINPGAFTENLIAS